MRTPESLEPYVSRYTSSYLLTASLLGRGGHHASRGTDARVNSRNSTPVTNETDLRINSRAAVPAVVRIRAGPGANYTGRQSSMGGERGLYALPPLNAHQSANTPSIGISDWSPQCWWTQKRYAGALIVWQMQVMYSAVASASGFEESGLCHCSVRLGSLVGSHGETHQFEAGMLAK